MKNETNAPQQNINEYEEIKVIQRDCMLKTKEWVEKCVKTLENNPTEVQHIYVHVQEVRHEVVLSAQVVHPFTSEVIYTASIIEDRGYGKREAIATIVCKGKVKFCKALYYQLLGMGRDLWVI